MELYDAYQAKVADCDVQIEAVLTRLRGTGSPVGRLPPARHRDNTANTPGFDARAALHAVLGVDPDANPRSRPLSGPQIDRRVRHGLLRLAGFQALHFVALSGAWQ